MTQEPETRRALILNDPCHVSRDDGVPLLKKKMPQVIPAYLHEIHATKSVRVMLVCGNAKEQHPPFSCDDEVFVFVHRGELTVTIDTEEIPLREGNYMAVPAHKLFHLRGSCDFEALLFFNVKAKLKQG